MDEINNNGMGPEEVENNIGSTAGNTESYTGGTVNPPQQPGNKKGMAIASMVLGIVAVVLFCLWYISIPAAIVGLILGVLSNKAGKDGMATAGIVLSIIALAIAIIWILGLSALVAGLMGAAGSLR